METKANIKSINKFKEKLHSETIRSKCCSIAYRISRLNPIIRGWINHFRICDMKEWLRRLDSYLRKRIWICIWKQWKVPKHRECALIKLDMDRIKVHELAYAWKGIYAWSLFISLIITDDILKKKGLFPLVDHYNLVRVL